ncbi:hypothetical protein GCM10028805_13780 [Spirosoma harenae]
MKTSTNATTKITALRWLGANQVHWRCQQILAAILVLFVTACQNPITDPIPTEPTKPDSSTITQPGNTTTAPGNTTATQPIDSTKATQRVKISWSDNDFQEILYDATALPVQYTSQYVDNQGTGHVRRYVYKLRYNPDKHLTRMDVIGEAGSSYTTYQYTGNQVSQTSQYAADGRLVSTCTYQYAAPNRLSQVDETSVFNQAAERRTYQYDATGNLSLLSTYTKEATSDTYVLQHTLAFTEYDSQRDVENLLVHMPLLPGVSFRTNNYGLKILRDKSGRELSRERYTYAYNEQGYPIKQIRTGPGGSLTATYTY